MLVISALIFEELNLEDPTDQDFVSLILNEYFDPECVLLNLPILLNGQEIQAHLNLKPGPLIGKLLLAVQEAQVLDLVNSKADAFGYIEKLLADDCQ